MSKKNNQEATLKEETCSFPGFTDSNNFYDFIYQHRERPDLWKAAEYLIDKSGPALYYTRASFVLSCAADSEVKKRAAVRMATCRPDTLSPSGMD
jgi:hypothetical protein